MDQSKIIFAGDNLEIERCDAEISQNIFSGEIECPSFLDTIEIKNNNEDQEDNIGKNKINSETSDTDSKNEGLLNESTDPVVNFVNQKIQNHKKEEKTLLAKENYRNRLNKFLSYGHLDQLMEKDQRVTNKEEEDLEIKIESELKTDVDFTIFYILKLNKLGLKLYESCLPYLLSCNDKDNIKDYIQSNFIQEHSLCDLDPEINSLSHKINFFIINQFKILNIREESILDELIRSNCLAILQGDLEIILEYGDKFKNKYPNQWQKFLKTTITDLDSNGKTDTDFEIDLENITVPSFVAAFNNDYKHRPKYRECGLTLLHRLKQEVWMFENRFQKIPKILEIANARTAFLQIYKCQDTLVKETALLYLIEILESDPLEMESAYNLVDLQRSLYEEVKAANSQNLNTKLQRLLIKAYAMALECILLHAASQHLNALTEDTKEQIWNGAEDLKNFNIINDEEIKFWSEYAIQGAQHIKTNTGQVQKWLVRLARITRAGLQVAAIISKPEEISSLLEGIYGDLKEAFSHIERHKKWFEEILILKKICRYSIYDIDTFKKMTNTFQKIKREGATIKLLYGIVTILEYTVLKSPNSQVQEEGIKLLLQFYTVDQSLIRNRIVLSFSNMRYSSKKYLRHTALVVLKLLKASNNIYMGDDQIQNGLPSISTISLDNTNLKKQILRTDIYDNVVKFLLRRLAEIKEEEDFGGQSFVTLLSSSKEDRIIPNLLKTICELSPDFQDPDIYGNTAYHIAAKKKNVNMIRHIKNNMKIDINAQDFEYLNTALHISINNKMPEMVNLILEYNANPDIQNKDGNTPLHLAAKIGDRGIANKLLESGANPNRLNNEGDTPLNITINVDSVTLVDLFLKYEAKVAEHVHQMSSIIIAAQRHSEETLKFLIDNKKGGLTPLEALEIMKMISADGEEINCSEGFCRFHLMRMEDRANYARAFNQYRSLPQLKLGNDNQIFLVNTKNNKKNVYYFSQKKSPRFDYPLNNSEMVDNKSTISNNSLKEREKNNEKENKFRIKKNNSMKSLIPKISPVYIRGANSNKPNKALTKSDLEKHKQNQRTLINTSNIDIGHNKIYNMMDDFGNTEVILLSIDENSYESLKEILQQNYDFNQPNYLGLTPLHVAVLVQNYHAIDLLLEYNAEVDSMDMQGFTPLHYACLLDDRQIIRKLLSEDVKANPSIMNNYGDSPLLILCGNLRKRYPESILSIIEKNYINLKRRCDDVELLELMIKSGATPLAKDFLGNNALHHAVLNGTENFINFLFEAYPELMWQKNNKGLIPVEEANNRKDIINIYNLMKNMSHENLSMLHQEFVNKTQNLITLGNLVAFSGDAHFFEDLIKVDVNIAYHYTSNHIKETPLHIAAKEGQIDILNVYLAYNLEIGMLDGFGNNILHISASHNKIDFLEKCLLSGKIPEIVINQDGRTPLHLSSMNDNIECVELLLQNKDLLRKQDAHGDTALHLASKYGCNNIIKKMAQIIKNIDKLVNDNGNTPLHSACTYGDINIIKTLITHGANIEAKDLFGATPLLITAQHGHIDALKYLLDLGADITAQDDEGETALHKAVFNQHLGAVTLLLEKDKSLFFPRSRSLVCQVDLKNETALHELMKKKTNDSLENAGNQVEILRQLIDARSNLEHPNELGETILHLIAYNGFHHLLDYLIQRNEEYIKRKKREKKDKFIPFKKKHQSIEEGSLGQSVDTSTNDTNSTDSIEPIYTNQTIMQLDRDSDKPIMKEKNKLSKFKDKTIFFCKLKSKKLKTKNRFIDFMARDHRGNTALHKAAHGNQTDVLVNLLKIKKVNINTKNNRGRTPLLVAARQGNHEIVQLLLDLGANVTSTDNDEKTILHLIFENSKLSGEFSPIIKSILENHYMLLKKKDIHYNRALHILVGNNHSSYFNMILNYIPGSLPSKQRLIWKYNKDGLSCYDIAIKKGYQDMARAIRSINKAQLGSALNQ